MYRVYFINFDYYAQDSFVTLSDAIAWGKSKGFEFRVDHESDPKLCWSPISGLRYF